LLLFLGFSWFLEISGGLWKFLGVRKQCLEALNTLALNVWRVQNTHKTHTENAWKYSRISGIVSCDFLFFWLVLATQNMDLTTQQRLAAKLCGRRPCRARGCRAQTGTPRPRGPPQTPQQRHAARHSGTRAAKPHPATLLSEAGPTTEEAHRKRRPPSKQA